MFRKFAVAAAVVIASSSAFAAEAPAVYAGLNVSSSELDGFDGKENGFGGFVGYKIDQNFAIEGGYHSLADGEEDGTRVRFTQTEISAIGTLPLSNGFSVYGRLGYNDLKAKVSGGGESVTVGIDDGVVYGAGLGYAFSPVVSGRVEVQKPHSDLTKITAGVVFNF
ncbi:MAG: hypothetical protein JWQ80_2597 [Massilia sp.]|nr:hypothetical protein [Massilia sp.]